jgi:hypothetical protein
MNACSSIERHTSENVFKYTYSEMDAEDCVFRKYISIHVHVEECRSHGAFYLRENK